MRKKYLYKEKHLEEKGGLEEKWISEEKKDSLSLDYSMFYWSVRER